MKTGNNEIFWKKKVQLLASHNQISTCYWNLKAILRNFFTSFFNRYVRTRFTGKNPAIHFFIMPIKMLKGNSPLKKILDGVKGCRFIK